MKRDFVRLVLVVAAGIMTLPFSAHADTLFVTTGHTGAQVQLDINHTQHWTYAVSSTVTDVAGALFDMKRGPSTSADIHFQIFAGTFADFGTATPILDVTLLPSAFSASNFSSVFFQDTPHVTLNAATTYTGVLWSNAPDAQVRAYFIKGGSSAPLFFVDTNGDPVPGGPEIVSPTAVPTPSAAIGALVLLTGLFATRKFRTP